MNIRRVFVWGDSHSGAFLLFTSELPFDTGTEKNTIGAYLYPFIPCHFSGATAHNLNNPESQSKSRGMWENNLKVVDKDKDLILLWFGEIDCRNHIKDIGMIDITIENYMNKIKELEDAKYPFVVMSIPPPTHDSGIIPPNNRPGIYKAFYEKLTEACNKREYKIIDMFNFGLDEKTGFMKEDMMRDKTHYKPSAIYKYVIEQLTDKYNFRFRFYGE